MPLKSLLLKEFVSPVAGAFFRSKLFLVSTYSYGTLSTITLTILVSFLKVMICWGEDTPPFSGHNGSLDVRYWVSIPLKMLPVTWFWHLSVQSTCHHFFSEVTSQRRRRSLLMVSFWLSGSLKTAPHCCEPGAGPVVKISMSDFLGHGELRSRSELGRRGGLSGISWVFWSVGCVKK